MQNLQRFRVVKDKQTGLYKCHLCSYKSVYGSSLRSHFAVHSNARPYGCDMCAYEAKRLPDLKKHKILKHIRKNSTSSSGGIVSNKAPLPVFRDPGTGLYRCQQCSYQSDNARCVRSHLAVHSHARPYACDTCSYEAKRSSDLSKHKIIKHGRIPTRRHKNRNVARTNVSSTSGINEPSEMMAPTSSLNHTITNIKQDGPELDHNDVLSDLDYTLMTPTRAAFEALRRCNMEPLDMFNEYSTSSQDSFLHTPVFPEPEGDCSRRPYPEVMPPPKTDDIPRVSNDNFTSNTSLLPQQTPQTSSEDTVFIKPEPPDDYFDHISFQSQNQMQQRFRPAELSKERLSSNQSKGSQEGQGLMQPSSSTSPTQTEDMKDPDITSNLTSSQSCNNINELRTADDTEKFSTSPCTGRYEKSPEASERDLDRVVQLERKNVTGSSLIRPPIQNPLQRSPEMDRSLAIDNLQSRESGYSSPAASIMSLSQNLAISVDLAEQNQGTVTSSTNTRKSWNCTHCDIMFFDGALYFMHMGLHNNEDPWRCNMCHTRFYDVYGFTSHFVNGHL